jgi:ABC-type Mn2+/Zn2+ transport system ATPase subunit
MLAQLDKGVFGAIIDSDSLFTTNDRAIAIRGRCTIQDWHSIWLGGGNGVMIALSGELGAGKSSIINTMLGQSLLPTASMSFA